MNLTISNEDIRDIKQAFLKVLTNFLVTYEQQPQRVLGLMTPKQVIKELDISRGTLIKWEEQGLKRYQPPLDGGRLIFYRRTDILQFLGVEDE